jgi:hypothetical protein
MRMIAVGEHPKNHTCGNTWLLELEHKERMVLSKGANIAAPTSLD